MVDPTETAPDPLLALGLGKSLMTPIVTIAYSPQRAWIGHRVILERGAELGRGADALGTGALDDDLLSRQHCALDVRADGVVIRDVGSRNGTFVNGSRVERMMLNPGDVIGLGGTLLVFGSVSVTASGTPPSDPLLVGVSPALGQLLADVHAVAERDITVLIRGETGVGKELVARRIHQLGRRTGEFVAVNCGGVGDSVLGSELFGHVKGAFSGADTDRAGLVESASRGTLLLDEIGDASPQLQTSLLRLLQDREYRPVGSDRTKTSDARIVAATHVRLDPAVAQGMFRQDLLARLRRWVVSVPPLRERREDILPIALSIASDKLGRPAMIDRSLALRLLLVPWPDNVRGLATIVDNAVVDAVDGLLTLTPRVEKRLEDMSLAPASAPASRDGEKVAEFRKQRPDAAHLRRRFLETGGNMKALAAELGISRNTLYRWFKEHRLDPKTLR